MNVNDLKVSNNDVVAATLRSSYQSVLCYVREYGIVEPFRITQDNVLLADFAHYAAAMELGFEDVPVVVVPKPIALKPGQRLLITAKRGTSIGHTYLCKGTSIKVVFVAQFEHDIRVKYGSSNYTIQIDDFDWDLVTRIKR